MAEEDTVTSSETDPLARSLEDIEGDRWGPAPEGSTGLVESVHQLRRVPLRELGVEGLRELLGQNVGVDVLLPLAMEQLRKDPLAEGDFYPGDLLSVVLRLPNDVWERHPRELRLMLALLPTVDRSDPDFDITGLEEEIAAFLAAHTAG